MRGFTTPPAAPVKAGRRIPEKGGKPLLFRSQRCDIGGSRFALDRSALRLQVRILFLRRLLGRDVEIEAANIVGLDGGGYVEIGKRNLLRALVENVHRLPHD